MDGLSRMLLDLGITPRTPEQLFPTTLPRNWRMLFANAKTLEAQELARELRRPPRGKKIMPVTKGGGS